MAYSRSASGITTKKGCTFRCSPSPENAANSALLISPAHAFTIQVLRHEFPIDRILQYGLDIIGTSVAVIDVIGMLPHIQRQERLHAIIRHWRVRSEEHTSELQSLMRNLYAVFCLKKK